MSDQGQIVEEKVSSQILELDCKEYKVIILEEPEFQDRLIVIDPYTWSWLALKLCEGVISYVGGSIFSRLIGQNSLTKQDLNDLLDRFVSLIAATIRVQLDANEKAKLGASAASLQSLFYIYLNNKDSSFIVPLLFKADEILHQSERLGLLTVPSFAVAGSIELAILQELYLVKRNDGDKKNIRDKALTLIDKANRLRPALENYNNSRFSGLESTRIITGTLFYYILDGQNQFIPVVPPISRDEAEKIRQQHVQREFDRLEKAVLYGLYPVIDKWKKISELSYPK